MFSLCTFFPPSPHLVYAPGIYFFPPPPPLPSVRLSRRSWVFLFSLLGLETPLPFTLLTAIFLPDFSIYPPPPCFCLSAPIWPFPVPFLLHPFRALPPMSTLDPRYPPTPLLSLQSLDIGSSQPPFIIFNLENFHINPFSLFFPSSSPISVCIPSTVTYSISQSL